MKLLQIGAGSIGRALVGPLFADAGWEVVFADVDRELVDRLNGEGGYNLTTCHPVDGFTTRRISGVRAIGADDPHALARHATDADLIATSVGAGALPALLRALAVALAGRDFAVDLLLAENAPGASDLVRRALGPSPAVGVVETSIGKMVPIVPEAVKANDPLQVRGEPYNTLICDAHGWIDSPPAVAGLHPVDNIAAYVERKLYVHNLGHAGVAYLGHCADPTCRTIVEALEIDGVREGVEAAMCSAVAALRAKYPDDFTDRELHEHVEDLLYRFGNRYLGDTVHRVGRDLARKLGPRERLIGAMRLCIAFGVDIDPIARIAAAALVFRAPDERGELYPPDIAVHDRLARDGVTRVVCEISGLSEQRPEELQILNAIERFCVRK